MRFMFVCICMVCCKNFALAQDVSSLPLVPFPSKLQDTSKPLIVYLSGDGGLNSFSKEYVQQMSNKGYPVILFNSLKYFWTKKSPQQTASDVEKVILSYKSLWKRSRVILIGYSFGADVVPFVYNRQSKQVQALIKSVVLISPTTATDFEIHITNLFGKAQNSGASVPDEINKINEKPLLIVQAESETDKIETGKLKNRKFKLLVLKGGHHYDSNGLELANAIDRNL